MEREAMASGGMAAVTEKQAVASTNVDTSKLKTFTLEEVCQPLVLDPCFTLTCWHSNVIWQVHMQSAEKVASL